jgi:hypothetical protein
LPVVNSDACESVWQLVQKLERQGRFTLFVNKKITGHSDARSGVKVVGLTQNLAHVSVKFQSSAESCYDGTISFRPAEGAPPVAPSSLKESLVKIAGIGWYDLDHPESRCEARPHIELRPTSLGTVAAALMAAAQVAAAPQEAPAEASVLVLNPGRRLQVAGLTKDHERSKAIFETLASKLGGGLISGSDIAKVIAFQVSGRTDGMTLGTGPVISAWRRLGYLKIVPGDDGERPKYTISNKAEAEFELSFEPYKGATSKLSVTSLRKKRSKPQKAAFDEKVLIQFKTAADNVKVLNKIRMRIESLEARKKIIDAELAKLNKKAGQSALIESEKLIQSLMHMKL